MPSFDASSSTLRAKPNSFGSPNTHGLNDEKRREMMENMTKHGVRNTDTQDAIAVVLHQPTRRREGT